MLALLFMTVPTSAHAQVFRTVRGTEPTFGCFDPEVASQQRIDGVYMSSMTLRHAGVGK